MAQTMTASVETISDGQIDNLVDKFRAALRKHRGELTREVAQWVLGLENLGMELYTVVRKNVEQLANMFTRIVSVNRNRTNQQALDATGRKQYTDKAVVDSMPQGEGDTVEAVFFKPRPEAYDGNGWITDERLEEEFAYFCLKPIDPISLAAVNQADPTLADEKPHGTHWKNADDKWCYASFGHWDCERYVLVGRGAGGGWNADWWFVGVCK